MRFSIAKDISIECAHQLLNMPEGHQCGRLHGHSYKIRVGVSARTLDEKGFVLDFGIISAWVKKLDHQNLNDFFTPSTAESFCAYVWDGLEREVLGPLNKGLKPADSIQIDYIEVAETATSVSRLTR